MAGKSALCLLPLGEVHPPSPKGNIRSIRDVTKYRWKFPFTRGHNDMPGSLRLWTSVLGAVIAGALGDRKSVV